MAVRIGTIDYFGVTKVAAECVTHNHTGTAVLYGALSLTLHGERGDPVDIDVFGPDHAYLQGLARAISEFNGMWAAAQTVTDKIAAVRQAAE